MTGLRLWVASFCCAAILSPTPVAQADFPLLTGTVFRDVDSNGSMSTGEIGLQGVTLQLFADDGDGMFDASLDTEVTSDITDLDGSYEFNGLGLGMSYFVRQETQIANGINIPGSVSELLTPVKFKTMIDDFSDQQITSANPIDQEDSSNLTSSMILGGQRDLHVKHLLGPAESAFRSKPFGLSNVLEFDQSAGVISIATVTWDGIDGDMSTIPAVGGLGGIDMTANGSKAFAFNLGIDAAGDDEQLVVHVYTGSEVSTATMDIPITNGTATSFQVLPFDAFIGGASLEHVDAIQLTLGGKQPSIDAQIGPFGSIAAAVHNIGVPEPSAILLGLFAAVWLVGSRKRMLKRPRVARQ